MEETLSPEQAKQIVEEANSIMLSCQNSIESKNNDFVEEISHLWEDRNAVEYFRTHKRNMEKVIENLSNNNIAFAAAVEAIANYYADAGNMPHIAVNYITLHPSIDVSKIKETFANGENGDEFGFVNPSSGPNQVMDAFDNLKKQIKKAAYDAVSRIKSINAFGNPSVQMEIAKSAGAVVNIMQDNIEEIDKSIRNKVDTTARSYINVGYKAIESSTMETHKTN